MLFPGSKDVKGVRFDIPTGYSICAIKKTDAEGVRRSGRRNRSGEFSRSRWFTPESAHPEPSYFDE